MYMNNINNFLFSDGVGSEDVGEWRLDVRRRRGRAHPRCDQPGCDIRSSISSCHTPSANHAPSPLTCHTSPSYHSSPPLPPSHSYHSPPSSRPSPPTSCSSATPSLPCSGGTPPPFREGRAGQSRLFSQKSIIILWSLFLVSLISSSG